MRRALRPYVQWARGWEGLARAEQAARRKTRVGAASTLRRLPFSSTVAGPPARVVEHIEAWAGTEPGAVYIPLAPAGRLPVPAPVTVEPFLVPPRETLRAEPDGSFSCETLPQFIATVPQGRALGPERAVISSRDELLLPLSLDFATMRRDPSRHDVATSVRLPSVQEFPGTVAVLATLADEYYGHWMLDLIPRIALLRAAGLEPADCDGIYMRYPRRPYEVESLKAAAIPFDRIVDCTEHPHIRAGTLVVASPLRETLDPTDLSSTYLNSLFPTEPREARRLVVSRRLTTHRRIVNEDAIVDALAPLGFETVLPETLTVGEQAALFAGADTVVAPHGSTLGNFVFMRPGAVLVEIQAPRAPVPSAMAIAARRGVRYGVTYGTGTDPGADPLDEDIKADPATLLAVLAALGIV